MTTNWRELQRQAFAKKRAELIEEIEFLRDSGETPERIASQLGYAKPESLERHLYRTGRADLAALFRAPYADRHRPTGHPCKTGCGRTCSRNSRMQICRACCDLYGVGPAMRDTHDADVVLARILRIAS